MMERHFLATLFCAASAMFVFVQGIEQCFIDQDFIEFPASIVGCHKVDVAYANLFKCSAMCKRAEGCMGFQFWRDTKVCKVCVRSRVTEIKRGLASFYVARYMYLRDLPRGDIGRLDILPELLRGSVVHLKAMMLMGSRFYMNFLASDDRVALSVDFRRDYGEDQNTLLIADKVNGTWENKRYYPYPIEDGQMFNIYVMATDQRFIILVDDLAEIFFQHRIPFDEIQSVETNSKAKIYEFDL